MCGNINDLCSYHRDGHAETHLLKIKLMGGDGVEPPEAEAK